MIEVAVGGGRDRSGRDSGLRRSKIGRGIRAAMEIFPGSGISRFHGGGSSARMGYGKGL